MKGKRAKDTYRVLRTTIQRQEGDVLKEYRQGDCMECTAEEVHALRGRLERVEPPAASIDKSLVSDA